MESVFAYIMNKKEVTMKKYIKCLTMSLLVAILTFTATGCSNNQKIAETGDTIEIAHTKGNATVNRKAGKVAVFDFGILDIMDNLNIDVEYAIPSDSLPSYLSKYKEAKNVGGIKEPDMEALYTFKPDVIFISGRQESYYEELSKIAPTVYVEVNAATYMQDVEKNTMNVAKIFNKETEAKEKLSSIQKQIDDVKAKTASLERKALIILTNDGNISAYGAGSRFGLIHDTLGFPVVDSTIETSTHGQKINYEYISDKNPDILFVVDRTQAVGGATNTTSILDNDLVKNINAYQTNKVIHLTPDYWYLSTGGLTSVSEMIKEAASAL